MEFKFVRPKAISDNLKCPICMEVFVDAIRLFCGENERKHRHTFCDPCISQYIQTGKNTCPECRTIIDLKKKGNDLLAREIINEFEVFCPNDCPWRLECFFSSTNPNAPKKKPKNGDKIVWHPMVDEEVQEKINQNTVQGSLEARILSKVDSIKEVTNEREKTETVNNTEVKPTKKGGKKKKSEAVEAPVVRHSNFDFLSSLFED